MTTSTALPRREQALEPAEVRGVAVLALALLNDSAVSSLDVTSEVRARLLRRMALAACSPAVLLDAPE